MRTSNTGKFDRWEVFDRDDSVPFVPDPCLEVLLDGGTAQDNDRRVLAYLEGRAREVIVVGPYGQVEFMGAKGRRQASIFDVTLSLDPMYFDERDVPAAPSGVRS